MDGYQSPRKRSQKNRKEKAAIGNQNHFDAQTINEEKAETGHHRPKAHGNHRFQT